MSYPSSTTRAIVLLLVGSLLAMVLAAPIAGRVGGVNASMPAKVEVDPDTKLVDAIYHDFGLAMVVVVDQGMELQSWMQAPDDCIPADDFRWLEYLLQRGPPVA